MVPKTMKGQIRDPHINQATMNVITLKINKTESVLQGETGCILVYLSVLTLTLICVYIYINSRLSHPKCVSQAGLEPEFILYVGQNKLNQNTEWVSVGSIPRYLAEANVNLLWRNIF